MDADRAATVLNGRHRGPVWAYEPPKEGDGFGSYVIGEVLGRGGMGTVFRAKDLLLERDVALKLIHPSLVARASIRRLFLEEARTMASIAHPNVVQVFATGLQDDVPFIAMELLTGGSLERHIIETGPFSLADALPILRDVAQGLTAIHRSGRVHGDVKPANVLLSDAWDRAAVTDMGLSFRMGTDDGKLRGTPEYLAPERGTGVPPPPELQPRADVYGLAVLAFELLTGRLPFESGRTAQSTMAKHVDEEPRRPSSLHMAVDPRVDEPLLRALRKDPTERTATPLELVRELEGGRVGSSEARLRFLVVDDDDGWRGLLTRALESRFPHATVDHASDGARGLAVAQSAPPHVALIDLNMPELNGVELTTALRELAPPERMSIVVLSGQGSSNDWQVLRQRGADRFFIKPCPLDEVCDSIERLLSARGTRSQQPARHGLRPRPSGVRTPGS
jgi:serine/threonine-protein kinase